jgi:hypothetical protein
MKKKSNDFPISAQEQIIIDLWQENISAQEIADRFGVTKNTIVGKVTRLRNRGYDLRKRKPPEQVVAVARRTSVPKPVTPWVPAPFADPVIEPKAAHVIGPKRLMDLGIDDCRYIVSGETASSYLFCGEAKASKSYCAAHHKLCYMPLPKKLKGGVFELRKLTYTAPHRKNVKFYL